MHETKIRLIWMKFLMKLKKNHLIYKFQLFFQGKFLLFRFICPIDLISTMISANIQNSFILMATLQYRTTRTRLLFSIKSDVEDSLLFTRNEGKSWNSMPSMFMDWRECIENNTTAMYIAVFYSLNIVEI